MPEPEAAHGVPAVGRSAELTADLLEGAEAIGAFLNKDPRTVYYLAARHLLPIIKIGTVLHARKSRLIQFIEDLENASQGAAK
jgi:hypothetical protein